MRTFNPSRANLAAVIAAIPLWSEWHAQTPGTMLESYTKAVPEIRAGASFEAPGVSSIQKSTLAVFFPLIVPISSSLTLRVKNMESL